VEILIALVILLALAWFVSAPLRRPAAARVEERSEDPRVAELEARKEAKYREIRDAELDRAQGKLSEEDWRRADAELRREAIQILRELDRARGGAGP
jgi:flagellar biosynthesis/type III secretory pathway M-ring protein FliF/YscJ